MKLNEILMVLPFIIKLMELAEKVLGPGTGEKKKELVMGGTSMYIEAITEVSTGGQKSWWKRFGGSVGTIVDSLVTILFPHKE